MAVSVSGGVVITGMIELDRMLRQMTPELNHRILGAANAAAAKPLIALGKSKAPRGRTGNLINSIGSVKVSTRKATEIGTVHVGPKVGGKFKGHHGGLVEFGTGPRPPGGWYAKFPGAKDTVMPKKPFWAPAFEASKSQIISTQKEYIAVKLHAFMKSRLGKAFIR